MGAYIEGQYYKKDLAISCRETSTIELLNNAGIELVDSEEEEKHAFGSSPVIKLLHFAAKDITVGRPYTPTFIVLFCFTHFGVRI